MKTFNPSLINCLPTSIRIIILLLLTIFEGKSIAQTLPPGFTSVQLASGIFRPTSMAFAPDGRIFVAEQSGLIHVIKDGTRLATPLIKFLVNHRGEGGLVGIAVDPNFLTNQYVYLYYTVPDGSRNRISRFKCTGDVASPSTESIVLNLDNLTASIHNGGAMHFKDGKLFVSTGDNTNVAHAQNLDTYHGKILRINPDGSIPSGNPYTTGSEQKKRVWAHGFRNPFTFSIQAGTGKIFVNDVGLEKWEEINDVTLPGKNYGWPEAEGNSTNPAFVNPVHAYTHGVVDEFGCAITGGTFFNPGQTNYPSTYIGKYFFQDYCSQYIKMLTFSGSTATVASFATGIGDDALYLTTGNDGNLYYLLRSIGSVNKILYAANEAPVIVKQPSSLSVSMGEPASFSVTASGKSPLMYQWRKNGINITAATAATFTIPKTIANDAGNYTVKVFNSAGSIVSQPASLTITAMNNSPVGQIIKPASGSLYRAGDVILFSGTAIDEEDGDLPASRFTWLADFHHDSHYHDSPSVASGSKSGSFTIPTRGETSDNVWYRLSLIVTDSKGSADTVWRDIYPHKSTISLTTQPSGIKIKLDGQPMNAPISVVSVEKLERSIGAVTPQTINGKTYVFEKWLHGGAETQTISTPPEDIIFTAVFKETTQAPIQREVWTGITGTAVSLIPVNSPPDDITDLIEFASPTNVGSDYGSRIRGYIHAPASGNYTFWISSDDRSELWLSKDGNPANKIKIASVTGYTGIKQWDKYSTQQSTPVALVSGRKYYIEALHKEAAGTDHLAVGWRLPNETLERPIPGNRLSRYSNVVTGMVEQEVWTGIPGYNISSIPLNSPASSINTLSLFEIPVNIGDHYGSRVRAYLSVPVTGNYTFWVASDDAGELWLSTDDKPTNKIKIAYVSSFVNPREWEKYMTQRSVSKNLVVGRKYYIEALLKEATGRDHLSVGWKLPDGALERPIPGIRLIPYQANANVSPLVSISNPREGESFSAPASVRISAAASDTDGTIVKVEFYSGSVKLGEDMTSPYEYSWNNVPQGNYNVVAKAIDNAGGSSTANVNIVATACSGTGTVQREIWKNIPGFDLGSIPVNSTPSENVDLVSFQAPNNYGDDYGSRIRGYICAPATGAYTFWIAGDDTGELWLSSNADPANKRKVALLTGATALFQWNKYPSQQSQLINLKQGQQYYIEALHKEGRGGDHVGVGWRLPNGTLERPIDGARLSPYSTTSQTSGVQRSNVVSLSNAKTENIIYIDSETNKNSQELSIYPNPAESASQEFIISMIGQKDGEMARIEIIRMTGEIIYIKHISCEIIPKDYYIKPDHPLAPGVYLINVLISGKRSSTKLLVK